jgi:hypothetical protein
MTCNWQFAYQTDHKYIKVPSLQCYTNFDIVNKIPPQQSVVVNIPVSIEKEGALKAVFRMSMYLKRYVDKKDKGFPNRSEMNKANFIWSNGVRVPALE